MTLTSGSTLGPYKVIALIGEGGMGSVYKARDTRLDRLVAIKTSHQEFNERFEREARAIAALNHPNICQLYDVGPDYLVMEFIEGPTLAEHIAKGPLPVEEALAAAGQIASALEAAHDKGITHRDLKPANIKLTTDGSVKVLDFGLAAVQQPVPLDPVNSPTVVAMSSPGMILGTAAYMSPEQARGSVVDRRSDIWAFGAVLYEMLTGKQAYQGESVSDILASVLAREPDLTAIPAYLRPILERAFRKDPRLRWRDIGDMRIALSEAKAVSPAVAQAATTPSRPWLLPAIAALFVGVALGWLVFHLRQPATDSRALQLSVLPPPGAEFVLGNGSGAAISPDGRLIVFVASSASSGKPPRLWIRPIDSGVARDLAGTEGARFPFWSPDGLSVGFLAGGKLKRIDIRGGPTIILAPASSMRGASWNADGTILFTPSISGGLWKVSASGGASLPVPVTALSSESDESSHRWPQFLPDGRRFLYFAISSKPDGNGLFLSSLDHPEIHQQLVKCQSPGVYAPAHGSSPGYLLWMREDILMAQPFDSKSAKVSGEPARVTGADSVTMLSGPFYLGLSVSNDGMLLFSGSDILTQQLSWFSRDGKLLSTVGENRYGAIRIAPDGTQVGASIFEANGSRDIWRMDLARGVKTRLTSAAQALMPVWSPNGREVAYNHLSGGSIFRRDSSGTGPEETILKSTHVVYLDDWSPDGRHWLYEDVTPETHGDLWLLPAKGERKPFPYLQTKDNESNGQFSPDGHWVAYVSDESGQEQIYVQRFPSPVVGAKWQVSNTGGNFPRWRRDGKEIFYLAGEGNLMSVSVRPAAQGLEFGIPSPLFPLTEPLGPHTYHYDVSPDGKRILTFGRSHQRNAGALTLLINWQAGMKP